jgi:hypothetical protein
MTQKIITVTPAGRRRYVEILHRYLMMNRNVIYKHQWWLNTFIPSDIAYLEQLTSEHPGFYELIRHDPSVKQTSIFTIYKFYPYTCDPDAIYMRIDDDICWMAPDAIEKLAACREANPRPLLVFANTINNGICDVLQQEVGAIPRDVGPLSWNCMCPFSWGDGPNSRIFHDLFFKHLHEGSLSQYKFEDRTLYDYVHTSVNFIAWMGKDLAEFLEEVDCDEERWLSHLKARQLNRPCMICGDSLVVHFAYYPQRNFLEQTSNALDVYRAIAEGVPPPELAWRGGEIPQPLPGPYATSDSLDELEV